MTRLALTLAAALFTANAAPSAPVQIRTEGLIADYYPPEGDGRRAPGVLMIGGSEGGLSPILAREAQVLAGRGYGVMQVSYFGSPGQPDALKLIPLETFDRALSTLEARPGIDPRRIGVMGVSKGAEAALLMASRRRDIRVVVTGVPSNVVWAGINRKGMEVEGSWTEGGKPLPFMPYGWTGRWKGVRALYEDGLVQGVAVHGNAFIPVEKIGGPVFMVCGEADTLWPSCPMARGVQSRLAAHGFAYPVTLMAFADAGHAAFGMPVDKGNPNYASLAALGGTADGNEAARETAWPKALEALAVVLKPSTAGR